MSKISELSDGGSLQSTDYLIAVRSGGNVKVQADGNLSLGALTLTGLTVDTNTLHVDATNNRVGIGTASPTAGKLQLDVGGSLAGVRVGGVTGGNQDFWAVRNGSSSIQAGPNITLQSATGTTYATTMQLGPTGETLFFNYNGSAWNERARLDASGNLLVGTTDATIYDDATDEAGHNLLQNGQYFNSTVSEINMVLNRQNSDGDILQFRKDGTVIGSIGGTGSTLDIGSGDTNLRLNQLLDNIYPVTAAGGSARDAAVDLGVSVSRFKDLYLSGGVYLGGTGVANKLDDYETGTFTPYLESNGQVGSFTYTSQVGVYTKVGDVVTCHIEIGWSAIPSTGATFRVAGLPFTYIATANADVAGASLGSYSGMPNTNGLCGRIATTGGGVRSAITWRSDGGTTVNVTTGNNISASGALQFSITYVTS